MPGTATEELQRIFKTLSDPTRMRILRLLKREELMVQELMEVLGMAQSRVSRHLSILREAGLLTDRPDGTYVFYRFVPQQEEPWRSGWLLVESQLDQDSTAQRDDTLLAQVLENRSFKTGSFFDAIGPEWDSLRKVFNDDALRARAIARLVPRNLRVADVGTGTGILACELARLGLQVIGIDRSPRMLEAARNHIQNEEFSGLGSIELREGEADRMPIADDHVDAAFAHMVLHYVSHPADVVKDMARIVRPGGQLVVVEFVHHNYEWMTRELGVTWKGFEVDDVRGWFEMANLSDFQCELTTELGLDRKLPAAFIATGSVPDGKT
ncbi:MAG: metalloregulator ArsR/SmtB family transcription factor [Myxococcota bacterium]